MISSKKRINAFTIVELLVVIVVIGILAAITIVSYSGIRMKAVTAGIKNQLSGDVKILEMYNIDYGTYPLTIGSDNCPIVPISDTKYCLNGMEGSALTYVGTKNTYSLTINNSTVGVSLSASENGAIKHIDLAGSYVKTWGGVANDAANKIARTADGGFVVVGTTDSYGTGGYDVFISKYTESEDISWSKTWGGAGTDFAYHVSQSTDGGYVIIGETDSFGAGDIDSFLVKFDSAGNFSWNKTWGGPNTDIPNGGFITADDGYVIYGGTHSFGSGNSDAFLLKYDGLGNLIWDQTWGGIGYESAGGASLASDGGIITAGYVTSFGSGDSDVYIAKYDTQGSLLWSRTWGGVDHDSASTIINTSDGGYVVAGETVSYGAGNGDLLLIKYDSSGNLIWNKTWGGANFDSARSVSTTSDGGYIVAGYTDSYGVGGGDSFLIKYDSSGNLIWNKTWGGAGYDDNESVIQTPDGGYVTVGYADNYGVGNGDAFLIKYKPEGTIANCSSPMCQSPIATVTSPSSAFTSPSPSVTNPSAIVSTPTSAITSPLATTMIIVAP